MNRYEDPDSPDYECFSAGGDGRKTADEREIERLELKYAMAVNALGSRLRECVALLKLREQTPTLVQVLNDAEEALRRHK